MLPFFLLSTALGAGSFAESDPKPSTSTTTATFRVIGLFSPDRIDDFKKAMKELPEITLVALDFQTTDATFRYDPAKAFPGVKAEQIVQNFDEQVRGKTLGMFGIKANAAISRDKLQRLEIATLRIDCKACSLAAYESIARLEGVEQATVSFKEGQVVAWIDPAKTSRGKLETALTSRGVTLSTTASGAK